MAKFIPKCIPEEHRDVLTVFRHTPLSVHQGYSVFLGSELLVKIEHSSIRVVLKRLESDIADIVEVLDTPLHEVIERVNESYAGIKDLALEWRVKNG